MSNYTELVPCPPAASINGSASPCPTSDLLRRYGWPMPSDLVGADCKRPTAPFWRDRMVTENVGPFKVTGHRKAVNLLRETLVVVKAKHPDLYRQLGTAGMLCCRWVRGSETILSNHSLGLAIDFTIGGILDPRGDDKVQRGLIDLYSVFKTFGWFWGAEFRTEDAMHFEVSNEVIRRWIQSGEF